MTLPAYRPNHVIALPMSLLCLLWIFLFCCLPAPVLADTNNNDTCNTAELITLDYSGSGSLFPRWQWWLVDDSNDYFSFTAGQDGTLTISVTGSGASGITTRLYNSNCSTIYGTGNSISYTVTTGTQYKIRLSASSGNLPYDLAVSLAASTPPDCSDVFPTPANVVSNSGTIVNHGTITNTTSGNLAVDSGNLSGSGSCDGGACTADGHASAMTLPANPGTDGVLNVGLNQTQTFSDGDYYFTNANLNNNATLTFSGSGTARIHIDNNLAVSGTINSGQSASNMVFFINGTLTTQGDAFPRHALFYATGNATISNSTITGAVTAANITVNGGSGITFDASGAANADFGGACTTTPPAFADFYFDDCEWNGSTDEVQDSSGNNLHGVAQNTTTSTTSQICKGGDFSNDSTSDYLILDATILHNLTDYTVSIWLNTHDTPNQSGGWDLQSILSGARSGEHNAFGIELALTDENVYITYDNATDERDLGVDITDNSWHHLVVSRSGTTQRIYVDGSLVDTSTVTNAALNISSLIMGQEQDSVGGSFALNQDFEGYLDELLIFDSSLTANQVQAIYSNQLTTNKNYDGSSRTCIPCPTHEFRFDECAWSNAANQVINSIDSSTHGTAINGANTSQNPPAAIAGDPGTCGYGVFDGNDDYVALPNMANYNTSFTITAWINANIIGNDQRIFVDDENDSGGFAFSLGDGGDGQLRFFSRGSAANILDTPAVISANTWYFVSAVYDSSAQTKTIYVNGTSVATGADTSTWGSDPGVASIGGETNGAGSEAVPNWRFDGRIDEVRIYNEALNAAQINTVYNESHACQTCSTTPDHFAISHDGTAINCMPEDVTITAHDASHTILPGYVGTITLSTSTGNGDWSVGSGTGSLAAGAADSGAASYSFAAGDNGSATLQLRDTHVETVNINVAEGAVTETSGSALASEDEDLIFSATGFLFYEASSLNDIGSQICGKSSNTGFGSQNLEIAAIRTSDATGACEAALTGTTSIEIGFECRNPTSCTANQLQFNGVGNANITGTNNGGSQTYSSVSLDFGSATDYTAPFTMTYMDAGLIRLHARYNIPLQNGTPSGVYMNGISNNFANRPFGFLVDDGLSYIATSSTCNSSTCQVAAHNFNVTGTAYCLTNNADDSNSNGIPDIFEDDNPANAATIANNANLDITNQADNYGNETTTAANATLSSNLIAPTGGDAGSFSASTLYFNNGTGTVADANWDEVGIITVQADATYFSTNITGRSSQVGRFIPHRLNVTSNTPAFNFFCTGGPVGGTVDFNYLGQEFAFATEPIFTVTAINSTGGTTLNYGGNFWKLATTLGNRFYTNNQPATAAILSRTTNGGNASLAGDSDYDGIGTLTVSGDQLTYAKAASPEAPFFALVHLDLTAADLTDSDSVCYDPDTNASCDGLQVQDITSSAYNAYGRLLVQDNYGPEDEDITNSPFLSQYYNGTTWLTNSFDDCTTGISMCSSPAGHSVSNISDPLVGGNGTLTVASNGNAERVDVCPTAPSWLTDLSDCTTPDDTCGIFTFGIYRGNDRIINWREIVR